MQHYGLIGYPLSHSFSEAYFTSRFASEGIDADYKNIELHDLEALQELITLYQLDGFNVTIPYKEKIRKYLHEIDAEATQIGAVNCVKVSDGKCYGYNTDHIGFEKSLHKWLIHDKQMKALVFGTGGASLAVAYVLRKKQIPYVVVSRNEVKDGITYGDLNEAVLNEHHLLINTTPMGMYPDNQARLPIPYHLIGQSHFAYDLIYNPEKTSFLLACEQQGASIKNGYDMLIEQAEASFNIFHQAGESN
jgi:shikimate dehydrogenase